MCKTYSYTVNFILLCNYVVVNLEGASGGDVTKPVEVLESAGTVGIINIVKTVLTDVTMIIAIIDTAGGIIITIITITITIMCEQVTSSGFIVL